jgi:2-oxoglutarate ferredoxin oxidoreductase subunit gamma
MHKEMIIAGFGGQGVLLLGKLLAETGMEEGKNVSWLPSYGPEMRGGTANCNVVISDDPVGSPIVAEANVLVAMNRPSLEKFQAELLPDGFLLLNSSIIDIEPAREDVKVYKIPANKIAGDLGLIKVANSVMAGAVIRATGCVSMESFQAVLKHTLGAKKADLLDINIKALEAGYAAVH